MNIISLKTKSHRVNLLAEWLFNGNKNDTSGNGYTLSGSATLTADSKGKANSAYSFNGSSEYLYTDAINQDTLGSRYTIISKYKITGNYTGYGYVIGYDSIVAGQGQNYVYHYYENGVIYTGIRDNTTNERNASSVITNTIWNDVSISRNSNTVKSYSNSIMILNNSTVNFGTFYLNRFTIGGLFYINDFLYKITGNVDNVRIFKDELSQIEIKLNNLYNI